MDLTKAIEVEDVANIRAEMQRHGLKLEGNRLVPKDDETKRSLEREAAFWDQRQYAR